VSTVTEVLQQQAGISTDADQIHVRGGRSDETVFVVNGVTNRDLVTGAPTAGQLNARSVAEVNVATGAYDVRFGNALSGVVEIRLKEGTRTSRAAHHDRRKLRRPRRAAGGGRAGSAGAPAVARARDQARIHELHPRRVVTSSRRASAI